MPVTVKVNGVMNSLVHKGSGHFSSATLPDVCKTPSPGGPVPIPYPNLSQSITLSKGTTTVKADGGMMTANKGRRSKRKARSAAGLNTLDSFLKDQGKLEEFQAIAIKEVLAWQLLEAMKAKHISRKGLAEKMKTSRSQISRLLDPKDGNVTLSTLQRAAKMVGRSLRLELV